MGEPRPPAAGFYDGYNVTAVSSVTGCHPVQFLGVICHEWGPINSNKVSDKRAVGVGKSVRQKTVVTILHCVVQSSI